MNSIIVDENFFPELEEEVQGSIFKQYEKVIVESLITSFGLDAFIKDRHGGEVDTIHNVRQIGKDTEMKYKNASNEEAYEKRGDYDSNKYHRHPDYIKKNREISQKKKEGTLTDDYTGKKIKRNEKSDLDHMISGKEAHEDRGRILADLKGEDLANSQDNLYATNPHTNRSKGAKTMDEYIEKNGDRYTEKQKENMKKQDEKARKAYEAKVTKAYYTSSKFAKDVALAGVKMGAEMGLRQALGFVFAEIWFSVKEEFGKIKGNFNLKNFLISIGEGIKKGFENAKIKYKDILKKFKDGALAGVLSTLTTTLCNIFFTTAKNVVKVIRQTWASLVEAAKILFINPDNLMFGDRMRAVTKIIAAGASVVAGGLVFEAVNNSPIGKISIIGEIASSFFGVMATGILSCTLLYVLDRNSQINKLVAWLNSSNTIEKSIDYFKRQAAYFEAYAAELMSIDLEKFKEETNMYSNLALSIENAGNANDLNIILRKAIEIIGVKIPWEGNFNDFMSDKSKTLVFD
ncbi:MAG: hypothetical protein ACRCU3_07925 [Eubacteriaceae bacterium]